MTSASSATGTGTSRLAGPEAAGAVPDRLTRALAAASAAGIGSSILIMIVASAARYSPAVPPMPWPPGVPPVEIAGHLPVGATYAGLWAAAVLGGGGQHVQVPGRDHRPEHERVHRPEQVRPCPAGRIGAQQPVQGERDACEHDRVP